MALAKKIKIKCPMCGKDVEFCEEEKLPPSFPFCSRRCKLIDLARWLNDEYTISDPFPLQDDDDDEG